mgnify:FL=1
MKEFHKRALNKCYAIIFMDATYLICVVTLFQKKRCILWKISLHKVIKKLINVPYQNKPITPWMISLMHTRINIQKYGGRF